MKFTRKTEVLCEKPVPVPLCPPQIPHGLTRDRTRATNGVNSRFLDTLYVGLHTVKAISLCFH